MRIITSDGEFERGLRQAGETFVVVDFTADWWVEIYIVYIRESVDSLCRSSADVQYMQYLSKAI